MNFLTHFMLGYILTKIFGFTYPNDTFWVIIFCSIFPDFDAFISSYISRKIKHREIFHSMIFVPVFALLATSVLAFLNPIGSNEFIRLFLVSSLSCGSHYVADLMIPTEKERYIEELSIIPAKGMKLFYPFHSKEYKIFVSSQTYRVANLMIVAIAVLIWFIMVLFV